MDVKSVDVKPVDVKSVDVKSVDVKSVNTICKKENGNIDILFSMKYAVSLTGQFSVSVGRLYQKLYIQKYNISNKNIPIYKIPTCTLSAIYNIEEKPLCVTCWDINDQTYIVIYTDKAYELYLFDINLNLIKKYKAFAASYITKTNSKGQFIIAGEKTKLYKLNNDLSITFLKSMEVDTSSFITDIFEDNFVNIDLYAEMYDLQSGKLNDKKTEQIEEICNQRCDILAVNENCIAIRTDDNIKIMGYNKNVFYDEKIYKSNDINEYKLLAYGTQDKNFTFLFKCNEDTLISHTVVFTP